MKKIIISVFIGINTLVYAYTEVAVSIVPQETFVKKIGGDKVRVVTMVRPGSDPHTYEPKASQMKQLANTQIYFPINIEFEKAWLPRFREHNKKMRFIDMAEGIERIPMLAHTHSHSKEQTFRVIKDAPYEWAGVFGLEFGRYQWSFSKRFNTYAQESMKLLMIPMKDKNNSIKAYEDLAKKRFINEKAILLHEAGVLSAEGGLYTLDFDTNKKLSYFILDIKKAGNYLFFTQYTPYKFEDKEHFFKDGKGNDVEPLVSKPEVDYGLDPHTWTSPRNVKVMAKNIFNALVEIDGDNTDYYRKNYKNFLLEIVQTDAQLKRLLHSLPKGSNFMVFHPSWGYFAKDYGLNQLSIEVEGKNPKLKSLQKIITKAREKNIKAIFTQKEFSPKSAEVIAQELGIEVVEETPLAKQWSKNLIKMGEAIAHNR